MKIKKKIQQLQVYMHAFNAFSVFNAQTLHYRIYGRDQHFFLQFKYLRGFSDEQIRT